MRRAAVHTNAYKATAIWSRSSSPASRVVAASIAQERIAVTARRRGTGSNPRSQPVSTAKSGNAVILRQNAESGKRDQVPVDVRKILRLQSDDVLMVENDILFVPDSAAKHAVRRTGEIALSLATGAAMYRVEAY